MVRVVHFRTAKELVLPSGDLQNHLVHRLVAQAGGPHSPTSGSCRRRPRSRGRARCARVAAVEPTDHVAAIASEGAALAGTAASALDRPIPSCPDWDMAKLVQHVGLVHTWAGESIRRRGTEAVDRSTLPRAPEGTALIPWLEAATATLIEALGVAEDDDPAGAWRGGPATAAFWRRRMANETAVHRWDAQAAVGRPSPVAAPLAADGIAEVLELLLPLLAPSADPGRSLGTLHLHCTDTQGEWLLALRDGRLEVTDGHAKADAALRGQASDLFLACWGRRSGDGPEVLGDDAVAQEWLALMGW
jgi:uncharacterized protein (TIGR03083 family)